MYYKCGACGSEASGNFVSHTCKQASEKHIQDVIDAAIFQVDTLFTEGLDDSFYQAASQRLVDAVTRYRESTKEKADERA